MSDHKPPADDAAFSPTVTNFLKIVTGVGVAVATVAAVTNPVGGAIAAGVGLAAIGTAAYRALPTGGATREADEDEADEDAEGQADEGDEDEAEASGAQETGEGGARRRRRRRKKKSGGAATSVGTQEPDEGEGKEKEAEELFSEDEAEADEGLEAPSGDEEEAEPDESTEDDEGWSTVEKKPRRVVSRQERAARRQAEIQDYADRIRLAAINAVGNFPMSNKPGREGCVAFGPQIDVPRAYAPAVAAIVRGLEGTTVTVGMMTLTFHIIRKPQGTYNLTLHRNSRADNPRTQANLHVGIGG